MNLELDEVIAHLSERGRLEFDLAVERATNARLSAALADTQPALVAVPSTKRTTPKGSTARARRR